jgi:hypothetical protein
MERVKVYVPEDLKARMAAVDVDWSEVARTAFEMRLGEIAGLKNRKSLDDVVQRLRGTRLASDADDRAFACRKGYDWAANAAHASELATLEAYASGGGSFLGGRGGEVRGAIWFHAVLRKREEGWLTVDEEKAARFWERHLFEERPSDELVAGFAEGALELWGKVKDKL